jgi:serine/threonine protein kinase
MSLAKAASYVVETHFCRESLAYGDQGTVYQAIGPDSKPVALKRCRLPKRQFSIDRHADLRHESRILVYLRGHPSVPECIGYETDDRFEYLVMPLLGCALAHGPILDAATSLSLAQQMVRFACLTRSCAERATDIRS